MRVAILQPNYIPWRGYFDFFKLCDTFVFYDDVQYTKNDWRNRNLIKTPDGVQWMSIPVNDVGRMSKGLLIRDVTMHQNEWQTRHLNLVDANYRDAPYYGEIRQMLAEAYAEERESLHRLCKALIAKVNDYLGIKTRMLSSSDLGFQDLAPTDRLVAICRHLGATEYLSGDAARDYLEVEKFGDIRVLWHRYHERAYPQLWGDFVSRVSIVDTLMNCGPKTHDII